LGFPSQNILMQSWGSISSIGSTRINGVHSNSALRKVGRQTPRDLVQRSLAGDICQLAGHGAEVLTGRQEHNASSGPSIMLCRECLREQQRSAYIRVQMAIYFISGDVFEAPQGAVGVVYDQDVNMTKGSSSSMDKGFWCVGNLQVGISVLDFRAIAPQFIDERNWCAGVCSPWLRSVESNKGM